jgi:hypothetical protein
MELQPRHLSGQDREVFAAICAFLSGRLAETATIDWALQLGVDDTLKRMALLELANSPDATKMREPWRSAWRLIEESWNGPPVEPLQHRNLHEVQRRLKAGDRSGSLVSAIVDLVAPRLEVRPFGSLDLYFRQLPKRPRKAGDLFSVGLIGGEVVDPGTLQFDVLDDRYLLRSLARALDAAVLVGVDLAERIGWDGRRGLGQLDCVGYVQDESNQSAQGLVEGLAPSVKLLHSVVSRLVDVDVTIAIEFVRRWSVTNSAIHLRLWASLSCDSRLTPASEVGNALLALPHVPFWNISEYPEISELRAMRFTELEAGQQAALAARVRKRPPSKCLPRTGDASRRESTRTRWAARELRRIEVAGGSLPSSAKAWLEEKIDAFPQLRQMTDANVETRDTGGVRLVPPNPDSRYDLLQGPERLRALETALSSARSGWDDDPAERAEDWISLPGRAVELIADLESVPDGDAPYPKILGLVGFSHSPSAVQGEDATKRNIARECAHVLSLLAKLPEMVLRQAIDGISSWFYRWQVHVVVLPDGLDMWLKLWPIAVEATNTRQPVADEMDLNVTTKSSDTGNANRRDILNTPVGLLMGVFLVACPKIHGSERPFAVASSLRTMRDAIITAHGQAAFIAQHRMIECLDYFLRADPEWTQEHLITVLHTDDAKGIALWHAVALRPRHSRVLKIIGGPMADRVTNARLDRETRKGLVLSLVIECLNAFRESRAPEVQYARIQQMIRSLDDEVRAFAAEAIHRFVRDLSNPSPDNPNPPLAEKLFQTAASPFLQKVWPQERSLATPGVSRALAPLPAESCGAFVQAVDAIERFLVPFECWSMFEYGLWGEEDGKTKLSGIDDGEKASALLHLLDLTIGPEGSVVPEDIGDALDQIERAEPRLAEEGSFRRLSAAARR